MKPQVSCLWSIECRPKFCRRALFRRGSLQIVLLVGLFLVMGCAKPKLDLNSALRTASLTTLSSFDPPTKGEKMMPAGAIKFEQASLSQVLSLYAEVSRRSVILGTNLPETKITFCNQTPMGAVEVLQALDTVLAAQGITTVCLGTQYLKVVSARDASAEPGPIVNLRPDQLPDSSSFLIYIVKSKTVTPSRSMGALSPFAKLPASILAIGSPDANKNSSAGKVPNLPITFGTKDTIFIFRDYSANVRKMLKVLEELEQQ